MNQSVYKKDLRPSKQFEAVILLSQVLEAFLLYWRIASSPLLRITTSMSGIGGCFLFISGIRGCFSFIPGKCCFLHHIFEAVISFTPWCWRLFFLIPELEAVIYITPAIPGCSSVIIGGFPHIPGIGGCYIYHTSYSRLFICYFRRFPSYPRYWRIVDSSELPFF